ncbi:MAG: hypothetical protein ACFCUQ_18380 [Kiloniellales bacterium]
MSKEVTREELARRLAAAASLNPPEIREIEFEVRSMGHLPPKGFAALSDADVAGKDWIGNRMIVMEWNYHIPTQPMSDNEANLKDFLDNLKDDLQGEEAVFKRCKTLGIQYMGTYHLGYLSFDPAGHFKTIFAFADDVQVEHFMALPDVSGAPADARANWKALDEVIDRNFRRWIGKTSPQRIISYRPAIAWRGAKP